MRLPVDLALLAVASGTGIAFVAGMRALVALPLYPAWERQLPLLALGLLPAVLLARRYRAPYVTGLLVLAGAGGLIQLGAQAIGCALGRPDCVLADPRAWVRIAAAAYGTYLALGVGALRWQARRPRP